MLVPRLLERVFIAYICDESGLPKAGRLCTKSQHQEWMPIFPLEPDGEGDLLSV